MADDWHCKQIPNGSNPLVVCERESLQAEIERLRAALADRDRWGVRLMEDASNLMMAIPKPFRKLAYLRSQRVREARRG